MTYAPDVDKFWAMKWRDSMHALEERRNILEQSIIRLERIAFERIDKDTLVSEGGREGDYEAWLALRRELDIADESLRVRGKLLDSI